MKRFWNASFITIALMTGASASAQAQEDGGLQEVVVTAQRREQNLQDVPVAVTALSTDTLENLRVSDVKNLNGLAPNLTINNQGIQSIPQISIRGISSGVSDNAVDPKVGIYLDGVYIGRSVGAIFDLADIERVEVLRGPQGTLFGRNATGGALSLVTSRPTGEFGGKVTASYGTNDAVRTRLTVNLPQLGPVRMKVSYLHDESDGWKRNSIAGKTLNLGAVDARYSRLVAAPMLGARDVDAVQFSAAADLADTITLDYRFDYTDSKTVGQPVNIIGYPQDAGGLGAKQIVDTSTAFFGGISNLSFVPTETVANFTSVQPLTVQGHNLTLAWEATDDLTIKSITGYRKFNQKPNIYDLAGSGGLRLGTGPLDGFFTLMTARDTKQKQWSEELQAVYSSQLFDVTAGAFYFYERSPATNLLGIFMPVVGGVGIGALPTRTVATNKSYAAYAQATVHVTEQLDVAFGGRYTIDKRKTNLISTGSSGSGGSLQPGIYNTDFKKFNYTGIVTYRPVDDVTTYAKIATGYVAGGILSAIPYNPETVTSYEVGVKSDLLDNRLRANLSAFYMDYKDLQLQTFVNGVQKFENAGKAKIKGVEAELTAAPIDGLLLEASFGHQNFDYKKYITNGVDISDIVQTTQQPKWNARLSAHYDLPDLTADGGHPFARIDARWRSKSNLVAFKTNDPVVDAVNFTPANWIVDARIGFADLTVAGAKASLSFFVQNLFDEDDFSEFAPSVIAQTAQYRQGRTMGIELKGEF